MSNTSVQVKPRDNANLKRIRTKRDLGTVTNTISVLAREEAMRLGLIKRQTDIEEPRELTALSHPT